MDKPLSFVVTFSADEAASALRSR